MLNLFVVSLVTLNEAAGIFGSRAPDIMFGSQQISDIAFARPPLYGSYDLHKQLAFVPPKPLINLEDNCASLDGRSLLKDAPSVHYEHLDDLAGDISCKLAFEKHHDRYQGDECFLNHDINNDGQTLLSACGLTFCSKCGDSEPVMLKSDSGVESVEQIAKEVLIAAAGFDEYGTAAPGFEVSYPKDMIPPEAAVVIINDDSVGMLPPEPATFAQKENHLEPPSMDTKVDVELDVTAVKSMVPPGMDSVDDKPRHQRRSRYQNEM